MQPIEVARFDECIRREGRLGASAVAKECIHPLETVGEVKALQVGENDGLRYAAVVNPPRNALVVELVVQRSLTVSAEKHADSFDGAFGHQYITEARAT